MSTTWKATKDQPNCGKDLDEARRKDRELVRGYHRDDACGPDERSSDRENLWRENNCEGYLQGVKGSHDARDINKALTKMKKVEAIHTRCTTLRSAHMNECWGHAKGTAKYESHATERDKRANRRNSCRQKADNLKKLLQDMEKKQKEQAAVQREASKAAEAARRESAAAAAASKAAAAEETGSGSEAQSKPSLTKWTQSKPYKAARDALIKGTRDPTDKGFKDGFINSITKQIGPPPRALWSTLVSESREHQKQRPTQSKKQQTVQPKKQQTTQPKKQQTTQSKKKKKGGKTKRKPRRKTKRNPRRKTKRKY